MVLSTIPAQKAYSSTVPWKQTLARFVAAQDVPANMQVSRKMGIRAYRRFGCGRIRRKLFARKPMIRVCNIVKITNLAFISSPHIHYKSHKSPGNIVIAEDTGFVVKNL